MQNGDRVGAVKSFDHGTLKVFGFGEYIGEEIPPSSSIGYSKIMSSGQQKDHKILLDDGNVIYSSECWIFDEPFPFAVCEVCHGVSDEGGW